MEGNLMFMLGVDNVEYQVVDIKSGQLDIPHPRVIAQLVALRRGVDEPEAETGHSRERKRA